MDLYKKEWHWMSEYKPKKQIKMAKKMNDFMKAKEKAHKSGAASFSYKGKTYKKKKTKTGMVIYKAA